VLFRFASNGVRTLGQRLDRLLSRRQSDSTRRLDGLRFFDSLLVVQMILFLASNLSECMWREGNRKNEAGMMDSKERLSKIY